MMYRLSTHHMNPSLDGIVNACNISQIIFFIIL